MNPLIWLITILLYLNGVSSVSVKKSAGNSIPERSFIVGDTDFLLDGEKFRYVAGSFHYFRAMRDTWRDKLMVMKAAGLTVIDTYVEWALHNPKPDVYVWDGLADFVYFMNLTKELDFYVILRPGPYICAERDNGGHPYWLFTKYPDIKVRTSDPNYLAEVRIWYEILFEKVKPYLYGQGGNILLVQVENEYGDFAACDKNYMEWVRDETRKYVNNDSVLFTVDIPNDRFECGVVSGVFATVDFGVDRIDEMDDLFAIMRKYQPTGPLVNAEYYPGWLTHWQEENQRRDGDEVARGLRMQLEREANVHFYMFFGGTNFGFTSGANNWGRGEYMAEITSYDYDAPMDEAGDATPKLMKIREVIMEFFPNLTVPNVPEAKPKRAYGTMTMRPVSNLFGNDAKQYLVKNTRKSRSPLTFEAMDQFSGFLLYETELPASGTNPTVLTINGLADRALIYVDDMFVGVLSRQDATDSLPINARGSKLSILVENQGRINFDKLDDVKGILGNVTLLSEARSMRGLDNDNWKASCYTLNGRNEYGLETDIPGSEDDSNLIIFNGLTDRVQIYIDGDYVTTVSQDDVGRSVPIYSNSGSKLNILFGTQSGINFDMFKNWLGRLGNVSLQAFQPRSVQVLENWTINGYPLEDISGFTKAVTREVNEISINPAGVLVNGPVFFYGEMEIATNETIEDTYLDPSGWGKGVLFVNGYNVGRYWPLAGPQITLYIPRELLVQGKNEFMMLELEKVAESVTFQSEANLDGAVNSRTLISKEECGT